MRLNVWPLLSEFLHGSFSLLLRVFVIVVPIMVVLELSKARDRSAGWSRVGRGRWRRSA